MHGVKYKFLPHFRLLNRKTTYDVFKNTLKGCYFQKRIILVRGQNFASGGQIFTGGQNFASGGQIFVSGVKFLLVGVKFLLVGVKILLVGVKFLLVWG